MCFKIMSQAFSRKPRENSACPEKIGLPKRLTMRKWNAGDGSKVIFTWLIIQVRKSLWKVPLKINAYWPFTQKSSSWKTSEGFSTWHYKKKRKRKEFFFFWVKVLIGAFMWKFRTALGHPRNVCISEYKLYPQKCWYTLLYFFLCSPSVVLNLHLVHGASGDAPSFSPLSMMYRKKRK